MRTAVSLKALPAIIVLAVLAYLPYVPIEVPGLLPGRVNGPGSLQLLATCLVIAGIALSYDVIFGRTGLLSFGHALFVAAGSYLLTISLSNWALPLPVAILVSLGVTTLLALVVGGIAFVVVTLLVRSRAGHAMAAVRENEARAAVLGFDTYRVKLLAIVVGAVLGGLGGIVHALVLGGSNPHVTTTEFTLALLIMVVLGGAGSMWGALLGGFLYHYADARLVELSGAGFLDALPDVVQQVLSEPLFILGLFFIIIVYFAPAGLTGLGGRLIRRGRAT